MADDPTALDHLIPQRSPAYLDQIRPRGIEVHQETMHFDAVREAMRPAQRRGVQAMRDARRAAMDERAAARGFASMSDAMEQTRRLSVRQAMVVSPKPVAIRRWRSS